jgi:hypothetical protein
MTPPRRGAQAGASITAERKTRDGGPPAERYPHVARWCNQCGWIEVRHEWQDRLFARALHEGGLAWGGAGPYATLEDALRALEDGLRKASAPRLRAPGAAAPP